jgi:hypothetical protein
MANSEQFTIKLGVNSTGVATGISEAVKHVESLTGVFKKIFGPNALMAGGVIALAKLVKDQAAWAGSLNDISDKLETSARKIQGLKYAAAATKTEFSAFETGIDHIKKSMGEAVSGNEEAVKSYGALGISVKELKSMDPAEVFIRVAKAVEEGRASGVGYLALLNVAGKESKELIAAMKDGAGSMTEAFNKSAFIVQRQLVDSLDDADKGLSSVWAKFKAMSRSLGSYTAGGFVSLGKMIGANVAQATGDFDTRDELMSERELMTDDDYGKALDIQTKLEAQLNAKLALKGEEHKQFENLKKKNDERERELKLAEMSSGRRKEALETEKRELQTQMEKERNELKREQIRTRIIAIDGDLGAVRKKEGEIVTNPRAPVSSDSLARIGAFRGGQPQGLYPGAQFTMHAKAVEAKLDKLIDVVKKSDTPKGDAIVNELRGLTNALMGIGE